MGKGIAVFRQAVRVGTIIFSCLSIPAWSAPQTTAAGAAKKPSLESYLPDPPATTATPAPAPTAAPATTASRAPTTTAAGAAQKAISTNPDVEAAWHAFLAAGQEQRSARGGYYPKVDLGGSAGVERYNIDQLDRTTDYDLAGVNLTVTQLLYDGFATSSNVARLGRVRRQRYFELLNAADSAALDAVRAYEDVRRYQELVALAEKNVSRHRDVLTRIEEKVHAGVGRSVDMEQATGRLALAESNLVIERSNLHDVSSRYQRVVGEWPAANLLPAEHGSTPLPADVVAALNTAYSEHPALAAAVESIRASKEQLRNRRSLYQPRLNLRLRGEHGEDIDRIDGRTSDARAEVLLSYNLFNGGSDKATIAQAGNLVSVAQDQRESTCRVVRQNLRVAYNDHQRIGTQLTYLKVHKEATERSRTAYLNQFLIGQRSLLDLLDTENEYFEAQRAYVNGNYDYSIASARTLAGMGRIRQAIGITRADQPALDSLGGKDEGDDTGCPAQLIDDAPTAVAVAAPPPVAEMPPPPPPPPTMQVTFSADSLFDFDKATVKPAGKQALDKFAADLKGASFDAITVTGHTDRIGSHAYNMALSARRAEAVKAYLVESGGIPAGKIKATGVDGADPVTRPGDCNSTARTKENIACLQPDRRVVVVVSGMR